MIFSTLGRLQVFTIKIQISRIDLVVVFIPMLDQTSQKGHFEMSNYPTYINRCCSKYRHVGYVLYIKGMLES